MKTTNPNVKTVLVKQHDQSIEFRLGDVDVCILPSEMEAAEKTTRVLSQDGFKVLIIEPEQLIIFDTKGKFWPTEDIAEEVPMRIFKVDTRRLFAKAKALRAKWLPVYRPASGSMNFDAPLGAVELPLDKFRPIVKAEPLLSWSEIAKHENARGDMAATILLFIQRCGTQVEKLRRDLSHYIRCATIHGHKDEFYFDGRRAGGCGFNGGFIIHGNEYSIHT